MTQAVQHRVFVDGNNVMGSRPDGWWRDRAEATRRLIAEITPLALDHSGVWTIVFDGQVPSGMAPSQECLTVVHTGHGRRDGADDRIVELVDALPEQSTSLVYTSDAELRARVGALGAQVAGARALLKEIAAVLDHLVGAAPWSRIVELVDALPEQSTSLVYTPTRSCALDWTGALTWHHGPSARTAPGVTIAWTDRC